MSDTGEDDDERVGYRQPPASSRFQKGKSGNPKGRPKGRNEPPYEAVLGQMVTIKEDGAERRVRADEAFMLQIAKRGLDGDSTAARMALRAIEEAREARNSQTVGRISHMVMVIVRPGSVNAALEPLGMATKLDRYRSTAKMALEPWIVEAALARLGTRRLSRAEQDMVVKATRTPHKVRWPDWWEIRPER